MLCYQLFSENLTNLKERSLLYLFTISFQYLEKYNIRYMAQLRRNDISPELFTHALHSVKKPDTKVSFIQYFWNPPKKHLHCAPPIPPPLHEETVNSPQTTGQHSFNDQ